jgi:hypothetical protein
VQPEAVQRIETKLALVDRLILEAGSAALIIGADGTWEDLLTISGELSRVRRALRKERGRQEPLFGDRAYQ